MSRRPNIWMLQREQCLPKSDETSKPVHMWFKNVDGNVIVSTVTREWTHEHMMVSYKTDILVCLLSPALHPRGDACLSPAVCSAADPHLGLPWHVQLCSFIHQHSKTFLAWKLFSYTWYVYVGWQMHTLECVNGFLGSVAFSFANFIWNVAWTQRSQLQGLPWLWDSRSTKNMMLFLYWTLQRKLPQSEIWSWTLSFGVFLFYHLTKGKKITHSTAFLLTLSMFNISETCYFFLWWLKRLSHSDMLGKCFNTEQKAAAKGIDL